MKIRNPRLIKAVSFGATWVLVTSREFGFASEVEGNSAPIHPEKTVRLWTDDYSNLYHILK